jgi:hypothetical protein
MRITKHREGSVRNRSGAAGFGIGIAVGAVFGLVAGFLYTVITNEKAEELLREKERQTHYKNPEYAERARAAIREVRKRVTTQ